LSVIVSHSRRFIFVKTKKTASTSIEIALSGFCDAGDIVTPVSLIDETLRESLGYPPPRNSTLTVRQVLRGRRPRDWARMVLGRRSPQFYNHIPASEIRRYVSESVWEDYFVFTFDRNPWDKVVSYYFWQYQDDATRPPFCEFVRSREPEALQRTGGWPLYAHGDQLIVDKVFRYEDLDASMAEIASVLGLPQVPSIPRTKAHLRRDRRPYASYYAPDEADRVAQVFHREIARFGYVL